MEPSKRLFSLDVLRGFSMLLLLYGSTIAWMTRGQMTRGQAPES